MEPTPPMWNSGAALIVAGWRTAAGVRPVMA